MIVPMVSDVKNRTKLNKIKNFLLIMNQTEFRLVYDKKGNHIRLKLKGN